MPPKNNLLQELEHYSPQQLKRLLVEHLTQKKLGLYWESNAIERDEALNANIVLPRLVEQHSCWPDTSVPAENLIIEGDNFDSLRLLNATHRGKIRVILIDPPYNTGNKDWVYNDHYVGAKDRWRHSQWLEFLYRRLTLARDLLTSDGVILVTINDENRARLELLMDEVFPGRRIGSLVWRTKDTGNDLSQRFSHVHEHVLVYANPGFKFKGRPTNRSKFRNPDNDERGDWSPQPLTKAHTYLERENTYYPIQNPETGYWYPCDPDSTWRFASEKEIRRRLDNDEQAVQAALAGLRSKTIEQLTEEKLIYFPPCTPSDVMQFETREDLLKAIKHGKGPILPKKKTPLLRKDLPDLDFWVGKPIAPGRPSRKEHWTARPEEERLAPLSSWIAGVNEKFDDLDETDELNALILRSARGGVATEEVKNVLGSKAFPYPKPLSLIKGLLEQATRPDDIVLDFFAGSGTTGHAVLELNAEDGGERRFILCSNTEANSKEPDKNLCRDVCAQRIRKVITGYGKNSGIGGHFAYLQLDLLDAADLPFDMTAEHAALLLGMREQRAIVAPSAETVQQIAGNGVVAVLLCTEVNAESLDAIIAWPAERLVVYSTRPDTVRDRLEAAGRGINSHSLQDAMLRGQTSWRSPGKGASA
ncbi:site-specific DNA-methyltransferase [Haliea sp.]|uniref:site-specific DNA-methyltransferase n=1 Tax=Haliea sp. TaxID=1932666 RepID=UPI000C589A26|nr:site-specific DNA-methyltransferase [Haliea sp.]MAD65598.1 site-specific DNA-methyltransferase [Haliea sp.]|tara:strand:+ start:3166 stop:5103 length:1938 start_codon:yes stop_codon:yes gene_type:complete